MINLTDSAQKEIVDIRKKEEYDETTFLRVKITAGGCSGFSYKLGFDTEFDAEKDTKYKVKDLDVVVDKKSALYLEGTTLDYFNDISHRGFTFNNPNATKTCGCGSSFQG